MSEVSGLHCTIFSLGPDDFELEDASRNGTYWNNARLLKASEDWDVQICRNLPQFEDNIRFV